MRRRKKKRSTNGSKVCERGYTLVEVMAATAVFTIFASGVGVSISSQYETAQTTRENVRTVAGCQQVLQAVVALQWDTMLTQNGATFTVTEVPGNGTIAVSNDLNADGDVADPNEGTNDLYRVSVALNNTTLTTYRTRDGI